MKPVEFVGEYAIRSLACCFSGGKDSLAATHYVLSELKDVDIDKYVAFVDTSVMIPTTIRFVKEVSSQFDWNLVVLRPAKSFWEQAEKKGMPFVHRRWCCYGLKLQPMFDFIRKLPPQRASVTGLRRDESPSRQKLDRFVTYDRRRKVNAWHYKPILEWSEKDVLKYIEQNDLPVPSHYRLGIKETCLCGAFSSKKEMLIVKAQFPELFQKFVELEGKFKRDWACFYDHGPVYARDLLKQKTLLEEGDQQKP